MTPGAERAATAVARRDVTADAMAASWRAPLGKGTRQAPGAREVVLDSRPVP